MSSRSDAGVTEAEAEVEVMMEPEEALGGAPLASYDVIGALVAEYGQRLAKIDQVVALASEDRTSVLSYFLSGNTEGSYRGPSPSNMFKREGAVAALDADFWQRAMERTDVLSIMPQARRDTWWESIRDYKCPHFEERIVRDTFADLLASRAKFFAERVDGIFRGLSGEHVTNSPAGFGKRMILNNVFWAGFPDSSKAGQINDLRCVIARFMRRDEPPHQATDRLLRSISGRGQWESVDGGALKIRIYLKGTVHIEVHPDMSWRLNGVLATMYPRAIPPEHRTRPPRQPRGVPLIIQRPLPFAVVGLLLELEQAHTYETDAAGDLKPKGVRAIHNALTFRYGAREAASKHVLAEAAAVLESIGGVEMDYGWQFEYPPARVLEQITNSGCIPDDRAHQFYPSVRAVAEAAAAAAEVGPEHSCLEPQAGLGGLADLLPKERTVCVEISKLRCKVLTAKGYPAVVCADFLKWAAEQRLAGRTFDRIVSNPPYDQGQWRAHLEATAGLLAPGGRLVVVLPSGAKNRRDLVQGMTCELVGDFQPFPGVSQPVSLLVFTHAPATRVERAAAAAPAAPSEALPAARTPASATPPPAPAAPAPAEVAFLISASSRRQLSLGL